ncbi:hypothetical protein UCRPA7_4077 [Phaeoacremonium minimum UCRPA7]|uniref:Mitochondrial carrier protein PET8 n=1 Tax=Phaeoacremonium minimum (strain UCR-PA7) TaxID=1286976 RepID=R8BM00_PHAM7|nr:hypothetical protein UCRPA7_4077 [Phaeoacremonium minimum UCRPA7]EOO00406.1 hypothetical protein UCRPA7_4077 [Phaeoacremonium minimum UCRPA7]
MLFRSSAAAAVRPSIVAVSPNMVRSFAGTRHIGIKESSSHDPDYEKHKEDSLAKQKQGKAHWKPELASDSEESVKADRSHGEPSDAEAMKRLQERTKQAAEEKSKAGTSMRDGL